MTAIQRQPKGLPVGGQFAAGARPPATVSLQDQPGRAAPLADRTPRDIDTEIVALTIAHAKARARTDRARAEIHRRAGDRTVSTTGRGGPIRWRMDYPDALERARTVADELSADGSVRDYVDRTAATAEELAGVQADLAGQIQVLEDEYVRRPWSRYFQVLGGHVHGSRSCSTCRVTTQFAFATELSGQSEADAVEALGPSLCSVCFSSAPVEWTAGPPADEDDVCPGSGQPSDGKTTAWGRTTYGTCPSCGESIRVRAYSTAVIKHRLKAGK